MQELPRNREILVLAETQHHRDHQRHIIMDLKERDWDGDQSTELHIQAFHSFRKHQGARAFQQQLLQDHLNMRLLSSSTGDVICDSVFGILYRDADEPEFWKTRRYLELFEDTVTIKIEGSEISERQRHTFLNYLFKEREIKTAVCLAILNYEGDFLEEYFADVQPNGISKPPTKPDELLGYLKDGQLLLLEKPKYPGSDIGLAWECFWDPEHGVGVALKNGEVVDCGQQGSVLF